MLFMVVEHFKNGDGLAVYSRMREKPTSGPGGELVPGKWKPSTCPEGLKVQGSWIEPSFNRCFQLMECDDLALFQKWILSASNDLIDFEIVPVRTAAETRELIAPYVDRAQFKRP
ncbi:DUF3303 domain-containing protein [Bradyrhizobium zhanjiangense]|uniref:DUF3303 domain-containing protein n=1 Tax=Bradyrhizobium zhanjiangense TaxID=1325107 RepID=UPI0010088631|nr:DUF3303 family protein [Bradyrhizobium zhanjiangense]